jgi:hypothetical protein
MNETPKMPVVTDAGTSDLNSSPGGSESSTALGM